MRAYLLYSISAAMFHTRPGTPGRFSRPVSTHLTISGLAAYLWLYHLPIPMPKHLLLISALALSLAACSQEKAAEKATATDPSASTTPPTPSLLDTTAAPTDTAAAQ